MNDIVISEPDDVCLFETASGQHGYFTSAQARHCGFSRFLLAHHARTGRMIRIRRGLYRLRDYPSFPREEVVAAWLAVGKDATVVSHDSALDLHELSDVIPYRVHLTVPRTRRYLPKLPGVAVHTTTRPLGPTDVVVREGMRVTSPARTILDAAEIGTAPEQIEMAIHQALDLGLATRSQFERDVRQRSRRVQNLIHSTLSFYERT